MPKTNSENIISEINSNVFFKEFSFNKNDFKDAITNQELEFADNIVWLDDILFIYQIKEMEKHSTNSESWYKNKVKNKAVKQIKNTLKYFDEFSEIIVENEKGHKLNIKEARENSDIKKIIIFHPNDDFPEDLRRLKFYKSTDIGLIHLFHSEDYYWICKYLITPVEILEYLDFREDFYYYNEKMINELPEQYLLGHFFETPNADHFNAKYISNLTDQYERKSEFDVSLIIENFNKSIKLISHQTEYYPIIKEIAKLNRTELTEFKKRISLSIEKCERFEVITPYRIYIQRTDCAFVFIPLHSSKSQFAMTALHNFTMAHKYNMKATKCIGVVVYKDKTEHYEFFWQFANEVWSFDEELEKLLTEDFPFRKTSEKKVENRYK